MRKKLFTTLAIAALMGTMSAQAQKVDDYGLFDRLSAGISLGTTGIGFEVAAPIGNYVQARMGYSFMPKIKVTKTVDIDSDKNWLAKDPATGRTIDDFDIQGKLNMNDFKLLFDLYPSKSGNFHFTAGFYLGKSKLVEAYNTTPLVSDEKYPDGEYKYWGNAGPDLGSGNNIYTVVSEPDGQVKVDLKTNGFKPYIGIGVGRAVPKGRVGVCFDFGVQFWGKPELWTNIMDRNSTSYRKVEKDRITNNESYCDDIKDAIKIGQKIIGYPVLTLRINGRIL